MSVFAEPQREVRPPLVQEVERRIAGRSPAMQRLRERLLALATLRVPVLVRGDRGTGRRHVARVLHAASRLADTAWVAIACAEEVAATPVARKVVFLDEVAALPATEQARWCELLRRSEEGIDGGPQRVIASSTRDLVALARDGGFDAAFAARLQRFTVELPPLRDRREDVTDLARVLADRAASAMGRSRLHWTREALRVLAAQSWPGNVRELATLVERLVAFSTDGRITRAQVVSVLDEAPVGVVFSRRSRSRRQREELIALIDESGGNLAEVARRLDMSRGNWRGWSRASSKLWPSASRIESARGRTSFST